MPPGPILSNPTPRPTPPRPQAPPTSTAATPPRVNIPPTSTGGDSPNLSPVAPANTSGTPPLIGPGAAPNLPSKNPTDTTQISTEAQEEEGQSPTAAAMMEVYGAGAEGNPYEGSNATNVNVTQWDGAGGNQNDSLETILKSQGIDPYQQDKDGKTYLDRVAEANKIKDPNVLQADQQLIVPTTSEATPKEEPKQQEETPKEEPQESEEIKAARDKLAELQAAGTLQANVDNLSKLNQGDQNNGTFGAQDLAAINKVSPDDMRKAGLDDKSIAAIKQAASYYTNPANADKLNALDTAGGGNGPDNTIAGNDVNKRYQELGGGDAQRDLTTLLSLNDNFAKFDNANGGQADGIIGSGDLSKVADADTKDLVRDMHISEAEATKLKETATAALDNFGTLDTGSRAGADDIFAGQDITALLRQGLAA